MKNGTALINTTIKTVIACINVVLSVIFIFILVVYTVSKGNNSSGRRFRTVCFLSDLDLKKSNVFKNYQKEL
jgi:Na+-transporting methylmalonyl-CoA/oxaloacetate decarboxylase gamma subunit